MRNFYYILFFLISIASYAQYQTARWYFGKGYGIDFSSGLPPIIDTNGQINTNEGCASIACGERVIYTDGTTVYNQNHEMMDNGFGLFGSGTSTQAAVIIPNPQNSDIYYIFTTYAYGVYYSVVDMSLNGGLGKVTNKNVMLTLDNTYHPHLGSEKLTAVAKEDGSGFWVATFFIDKIYVFEVSDAGVNHTPIISPTSFFITPTLVSGVGGMKFSPDGSKLAIASEFESPSLSLFDFNPLTGIASNERILKEEGLAYSVEFSPDSQVLYLKSHHEIIQYDVSGIPVEVYSFWAGSGTGTIQLGLDGKIYISSYHSQFLGAINNPNQLNNPNYNSNEINIGTNVGNIYMGLPNFVTSFFIGSEYFKGDILVNGESGNGGKYCFGGELIFTPDICGLNIETYEWDFGDGNISTEQNPAHTYADIGIYNVTLVVTAPGGQSNMFTIEIEIVPLPDSQNAELKECPDPYTGEAGFDLTESYPLINPNGEDVTFSFHLTEEDAENNTAAQPLTYTTTITNILWVRVENEWDCITIVELELIVNSIPTFTIEHSELELCENMWAELEITTDATNTVNWYLNQTDTTPVHTGNPFTTPNLNTDTTYWVEVVSDKGCPSEREEITIEIVDERTPEFTQIQPVCFEGIFTLPDEDLNEITGSWTPAIDNTQTTTYTFHPDAGQCAAEGVTMTVEVVPIPEITLPSPIEICSGETFSITVSTTGENVNWYENETDTTSFFTGLDFSEELTETTTFWLEAIDGDCLSGRIPLTITVNPLPTIQAEISNPVCEGNPAELSVTTNGQTVNWYDSETSITPIFTGNPFITPNLNETTIYWAEAISSENCTSERIPVTAVVTDEITPEFNFELQYCLNSPEIILPTTDENGITGTWFPTTIQTSNLGTEIYTFTPDLECGVPITKEITIVEIIAPEFDELIQNYCLNATPEILPNQSDNGIQGTWFPSQINTSLQGITTYIFTPNDGQCSEEFELSVTVYPHPDMDLEEELLICEGDSFDYSAPSGFDSYEWKNESNQIISTTREVTFTQEGIYTLTVEINGVPCDLSRNIEVKFSTPPTILEVKTTENSITVYATGGNPLEYSMNQVFWQSSPTFTNLQPGIFNVYVRDAKGCSTTAKQTGILGVPNFISPNGDGYNDVWELRGLEVYPNTRLQIFDRYGKVFVDRMIDSNFTWDGKYNSQPLPSGAYWYILILESGEKISGNINIRNY